MADAFGIATGVLTVGDVCIKISKCLRELARVARHLDATISGLDEEIVAFHKVYDAFHEICASETTKRAAFKHAKDPCARLFERAQAIIAEGQRLVDELDSRLQRLLDSELTKKTLGKVRKTAALFHEQEKFGSLRRRLGTLSSELNTMILGIELVSNANFRLDMVQSLDQLPRKIAEETQSAILQLKAQISRLETAEEKPSYESIVTAKSAVAYSTLNCHFYVNTPDTGIWTGRAANLEQLRKALLDYSPALPENTQRRFVIYGTPGAGKTQVCSKFAQDFRESFWGIFWIDGTSPQSASASWRDIAKLGRKEPHEDAGKNWLANLQSPWLLIIDSADESENTIQSNFPSGDRGCIIITTRNPRITVNATVGSMFLEKLDQTEATDLIRKASCHSPWDASAKEAAFSIAKRLGYLPLALIHAGRAILHQFCTLNGYITFFDQALGDFRRQRLSRVVEEDEVLGRGALSSFEIIYSGLESRAFEPGPGTQPYLDAVELGNMFAFFHCNDIRLETFLRAGRNMQRMSEEAAAKHPMVEEYEIQTSSWTRLKQWALTWAMKFWSEDPALPQIFRSIRTLSFSEQRLRRAIDLLVRLAMISESSDAGCYSIHPLVHDWLRSRLSLAEQALWCHAAGNVLASSIKLPPLVDEPEDRHYYIRLLSHVRHVSEAREQLTKGILDNQGGFWRQQFSGLLKLRRVAGFTAIDAGNLARYSRVFMETGQYADAERLQVCVSDFLRAKLGPSHRLSIQIQLALSATLWHQGKTHEAIELQEGALAISVTTAGSYHPQTLRIMDKLGESRWMCGQLREAKQILEAAVDGMEGRPGMEKDKFTTIDHLGRVYDRYLDWEKARELHEQAYEGLKHLLGPDDPDTLVAKDNLAMVLLHIGGAAEIDRAHRLMQSVYASRVKRFGPEHFYTLWAAEDLARATAALGESEGKREIIIEAKDIGRAALAAALYNENLGPMHIGVLSGRAHLANIDILLGNYAEAEAELREVMDTQKTLSSARHGTHPDRIGSMEILLRCMEIQGRTEDAIAVCDSIVEELGWLGGHTHPLRIQAIAKRDQLVAQRPASTE